MDTKVNVQNAKNVFERKAQEFQKKIENGKHNRNDEELALEVATKITEADKAAIKEIRQEYEQLLQKDEEAKKNIVDTQQTQKVKALDADGVFTKAANPLKIHQIVAMSNQADANKLVLDYSGSKSAKIKSKVQALTGGNNRILIEKKGNTFVYEGTNERALVYEGVQLLPATAELASRKGKEYVEQKTQATLANEKKYKGILNNFKAMGFDFQKEMQLRLPNGSPDGKKEMKIAGALYDLTEKVLEDLVIGALNGTSTPKNMEKPFEDVMRGGTVAEFISLSGQHNISVLTEKQLKEKLPDERLGEKLYDFLNEGSNEDKVVNYLNTRRKELYTEKVTKNQNFTMDAKKQGLKVENGKVKDKDGKEVALDDNQVFIEGLDVDRKDPKEAIWMQHQIEAEMERIVENIKNGKITMPENDQPFGTNALWTSHYIEFDQKNGVMDWEVFASNLFNGHKETEKIFDNDSNTKKVVNYMNKLWKEKYTDLVKEQKNIAEISKETDINKLSSSIDTYFTEIQTLLKKTYLNESEKAEVRIKKREISKALPLLEE
ncbi:MAG: hypothetical protein LBU27_02065 [Candidatus Peribacteria bacterium]|nr:hypothetical protein [Candidatus Peribacteria bacterium]